MPGGATGFGPCAALPDTAFYHYAVQQNLYAAILARNYGVRVHAMYLAQFHPRLKAYHCVRVPELPCHVCLSRCCVSEQCSRHATVCRHHTYLLYGIQC